MLEDARSIKAEKTAMEILGDAWGCTFRQFGSFSPIDWTIHKGSKLVAVAEYKERRNRKHDDFDDVFLNVQKWMSLTFVGFGLEVPSLFIVGFTDKIMWVDLSEIDPTKNRVAGRTDRGRGADMQPVIKIPISSMTSLEGERYVS